ncbi:MAG: secondary thiamine-phosphate synthase enzyme YjbQ [Halobacteriota archaeon]|nr:secondary thiamine-phosphate synthase enzyme YjbQ [Halobacteriota archaeon]
MKKISLSTRKEIDLFDITGDVSEAVKNVKSGICTVFTKHTTTGIIINENESGLKDDILTLLKRIVPKGGGYKHDRIDNNAHSHLMSIMLGPGVTVPIEDGKLVLGPWQSIFFVECDGPRNRELFVNIIEG